MLMLVLKCAYGECTVRHYLLDLTIITILLTVLLMKSAREICLGLMYNRDVQSAIIPIRSYLSRPTQYGPTQ